MLIRITRPAAAALALTLGLSLAGCAGEPTNRSLDSIKQPVVSRTNMTLDLNASATGLSIPEEKRMPRCSERSLKGFLRASGLRKEATEIEG